MGRLGMSGVLCMMQSAHDLRWVLGECIDGILEQDENRAKNKSWILITLNLEELNKEIWLITTMTRPLSVKMSTLLPLERKSGHASP